jgi:hypothetical protein
MRVLVCAWDPSHTLSRAELQHRALKNGAITKLVEKYGNGTPEMHEAFVRYKLASFYTADGYQHCAECGALMDEILSSDGIKDRLEATRDVVHNFDKAVERTRRARQEGS